MSCEHKGFKAYVEVNRLEDSGLFNADLRIDCAECGLAFQFLGLPAGLNLQGAAVSIDGTEARLAIAPSGTAPTPLEDFGAVMGFTARRADDG